MFLDANDRTDRRTCAKTDPRVPFVLVAFIPAVQIPLKPNGTMRNRLGMIRRRIRHAGHGKIGIPDGLDPFATVLFDDTIKRCENIVQLAKRDGRIGFGGEIREVHKVQHHHRYFGV